MWGYGALAHSISQQFLLDSILHAGVIYAATITSPIL